MDGRHAARTGSCWLPCSSSRDMVIVARETVIKSESIAQSRYEGLQMLNAAPVVNRAGKLVFATILLSILVAILFGSFSLILPHPERITWQVPILAAAGITVTLLIARANYRAVRPWIIDGVAAVLGLTSAILGIALTFLIAYGLNLQIAEHKGSRDSFVYQMTNSAVSCCYCATR